MIVVSNKPRIAVIPAGQFQIQAILDAQSMGYEVVAFDGNPQAPGLKIADFPEAVNPMDTERAIALARRYGVVGVVSVANDPCIVPLALLCEALHLPGITPELARLARDKSGVRERLRTSLPHYCPRFCVVDNREALPHVGTVCGWPAVLKPCLSSGSKGVVIVNDETELDAAYQYSSRFTNDNKVLAEELLIGQEVSVEGLVADGETYIAAVTDKMTTPPPFCVEIGHSIPSRLSGGIREEVIRCVRDITGTLGLNNCALHAEIYATARGPKLVEFGARLGGGCITSHLVPLATGINLNRAVISMATGHAPAVVPTLSQGAAIRFMTPPAGRVTAIRGLSEAMEAPGVVEVACTLSPGDIVSRLENSDHRVGYVITTGPDAESAMARAAEAVEQIQVETMRGDSA
ncbi:MAG: ATP-grasp domain-containing protein [Candidatus Hydrogenedentales bacterium]|jgi:biotin carboxylase